MRIPLLLQGTVAAMPQTAAKVLLALCGVGRRHVKGNSVDFSAALGICPATLRRDLAWLTSAGLIDYHTTSRGWVVTIRHGKRFTWAPHYPDDRLRRASPRACHALLAICRALDNRLRAVRMRVETIARRIGRSIRTAHLALQELRLRQIVETVRTGRSSWFSVFFREAQEQGELFECHQIAHQSSILLRILSSISQASLSTVLTHLARRPRKGQIAGLVRDSLPPNSPQQRRFAQKRLAMRGIIGETADRLVRRFHVDEICDVLSMTALRGVKPDNIPTLLETGRY